MSVLSLFPPAAPKGLPDFSTLLISGSYHPSAPVHLALSLRKLYRSKPILLHPSKSDFKTDLIRFNDAWLLSRSGHGNMTDLTSNIDIFYPPSPAHLCLLLSVLCAPDSVESGVRRNPPDAVILVEPSRYLFSLSTRESGHHPSLSMYLNLIHRSLACISKSPSTAPKFVLFDACLHDLKAPITNQPSIFPEGHNLHQPQQIPALLLVEKCFELVGIFEDDSSYIPSSQGDEDEMSESTRKQLRIYRTDQPLEDDILFQWNEYMSAFGGIEGTWFIWP